MKYYDEDEKKLIESIEKEEWSELPDMSSAIVEAEKIARATTAKNERMNIRMNEGDIEKTGRFYSNSPAEGTEAQKLRLCYPRQAWY